MIILIHETVEGMTTKKADAEPDYKTLGYTQINDGSGVKNALKKAGITKVSDSGQCGPCVTQKNGTTCNIFIKPEKTKPTKETFTDIRMAEGFRNREAYQNTIESMKFSNGQTGAGQNRYNQF